MKTDSLRNHPLITGTLLLTLAGLFSRVIGFFYRIFLSQTIGAEAMGIYQLTIPIHILTISLTSSAIQTAISRFVAQAAVNSSVGTNDRHNQKENSASGKLFSLCRRRTNVLCSESCYLSA